MSTALAFHQTYSCEFKAFAMGGAVSQQRIEEWVVLLQHWVSYLIDQQPILQHFGFRAKYDLVQICIGNNAHRPEEHSPEMTQSFAEAVCHSPELHSIAQHIASLQPFVLDQAESSIVAKLRLFKQREGKVALYSNLRLCLRSLNSIHRVAHDLAQLKDSAFSYDQPEHVHLLDRLWFAAFPNKVNFFEDFSERDWGDLGFQKHNDPASDFRGLGLLGLRQLVYFFEHHAAQARAILKQSAREDKYFPFAATALSIGAFTVSLLREARLHRRLLGALDTFRLLHPRQLHNQFDEQHEEDEEEEEEVQTLLQESVMEVFCEVYERFASLWQQRTDARTVMDFPRLFSALQSDLRSHWPALRLQLPSNSNNKGAAAVNATASIIH